ncbi:DUF1700 domain-containing protein [Clostridiaceae bacterium]|nr:DUF1700 domain-containing protein [Clostridiaceae bacterium]RKI09294.1 DUF1700 domain-containing protein [bacterium 1XD21-70]
MNKEEFLQGLTKALAGKVPPDAMRENLRYYEEYIRTEMEKGRSENDIMEELGSPRLIARTIIDTTPGAGEEAYGDGRFGGYSEQGNVSPDAFSGNSRSRTGGSYRPGGIHYYDLNKWYWKLLGLVVAIMAVTLVLMVIGGILSIVIPLLPVIGVVVLVMWLIRGGSGR